MTTAISVIRPTTLPACSLGSDSRSRLYDQRGFPGKGGAERFFGGAEGGGLDAEGGEAEFGGWAAGACAGSDHSPRWHQDQSPNGTEYPPKTITAGSSTSASIARPSPARSPN